MKRVGVVLVGVALLLVVFSSYSRPTVLSVQTLPAFEHDSLITYGTNSWWLELTGITNDTAYLTICTPPTVTNNVYNLFFTTNLQTPPVAWSRVARCLPGQTNPVVTNLPPAQGFFMLNSPIRPGFDQTNLPPNDDGSTGLVPLPFTMNFLSNSESGLYVNNNGNVTFDKPLGTYTPVSLAAAGVKIIAPFWADVDTRTPPSDVVKYGTNMIGGHNAFGVDWVNVGYFNEHADKLLSCQLVIIDRSDIAPGNFDMEFNYDRVEWEAGDVSGGSGGYWQGSTGGPARAGFSDGVMDYELPGSGVGGALLDTNTVTGLVYNSLKSPLPGRYRFLFRNGAAQP